MKSKTIQIKENFFDLTAEQIKVSKEMYEGKIIKCLVAPYHTYDQLEKIIPFTKTTYLFPERECSVQQLCGLLSMIVASPLKEEFRIVTTSQNVIIDMVGDCVRVLTEKGEIVPSPIKTFMANIHDIRYSLLENDAHKMSASEKSSGVKAVNKLLDKINSLKSKSITEKERKDLIEQASMIGEPLIENKLKQMIGDIKSK